jgi:hypothetical protein
MLTVLIQRLKTVFLMQKTFISPSLQIIEWFILTWATY